MTPKTPPAVVPVESNRTPAGTPRLSQAPVQQRVRGHEGVPISVWVRGEGPARVLCIHGAADHARIYDPLLDRLPAQVTSWAVDLRGHGDSGWAPGAEASPEHGYRFSDYLADLEQLVPADSPPVVLVGHSLGAWLALEFAASRPQQVAALSLLDIGFDVVRGAMERIERGFERGAMCFESLERYREQLGERYWLADLEALDAYARYGSRAAEGGGLEAKVDPRSRAVLYDRRSRDAMFEFLRRLECPTQVLRGNGSAVLARADAEHIATNVLRRGEFAEIARAGHALLLDNPSQVADVVGRFVLAHLVRS